MKRGRVKSKRLIVLSQQQSYRRIPVANKKGLTALTVELCEAYFRRFPNDSFALIWFAMAKIQLSQYAQAKKALRNAMTLSKGNGKMIRLTSVQMGHLFDAKGDLKKTSFWCRRGLRADPKYGTAYIYLGHIAFRSGQINQAEKFYRKAIKRSAQSLDETYFNLGGVLLAAGRYEEAIKCYRKAIEIDPKYSIAKKRLKDALTGSSTKKS